MKVDVAAMSEESLARIRSEFAAKPFGSHSPELQALLEVMRSAPIPGKAFLYMIKPNEEWALARMSDGKTSQLELCGDVTFNNILDGEAYVFEQRLSALRQGADLLDAMPRSPARYGELLAYADRESVRAGEAITFYASSESARLFQADVVRLRCPEVGPAGEPFSVDGTGSSVDGEYRGIRQALRPGSYIEVSEALSIPVAFSISVLVYPTLLSAGTQTILSMIWDDGSSHTLQITRSGHIEFVSREQNGMVRRVRSGRPVPERSWSVVAAAFDGRAGTGLIGCSAVRNAPWANGNFEYRIEADFGSWQGLVTRCARLTFAADLVEDEPRSYPANVFNGRLERPRVYRGAFTPEMARRVASAPHATSSDLVADWDFSIGIDSEVVRDVVGLNHGRTRNMPQRGVKGVRWSGATLDWRLSPADYGAIHFHEDDLIDAEWEPTASLNVPRHWESGCYALRLVAGDDEFFVPFFVRPPQGEATSDVAFMVPTATYAAYANMRLRLSGQLVELQHGRLTVVDSTDLILTQHSDLGASTYDTHRDGSLVCYSSMRRPVTNFRPNGRIYKFCQDLLITAWLEHEGVRYDVVTDEDVHREGVNALRNYRTIISSSHPEYISTSARESLETYLANGGRLMYLGGNGYYTAAEFHWSRCGTVEVRRPGLEALWPIDHTEGIFSFTRRPAGPFSKIGMPPESLIGVGFVTQGFDACSYYKRTRASYNNDRVGFIFEGVEEDIIGDFGLLQGGAAGYEIDRFDVEKGSPPHGVVLASSGEHSNVYDLMVSSLVDRLPPEQNEPDQIRADIVFFETSNGGAVFSVGSIAWSGSLGHNDYVNNVATVSANVLRRFRLNRPFILPGEAKSASDSADDKIPTEG